MRRDKTELGGAAEQLCSLVPSFTVPVTEPSTKQAAGTQQPTKPNPNLRPHGAECGVCVCVGGDTQVTRVVSRQCSPALH